MAYQERGSGPPHFDGKNYQMWSKRMGAFLRGTGQILWDVTVDTGYVQPMDFLKDRLGDQRGGGGSEWEPIKILLEGD
jgi:hypothetical protein